MGILFRKPLVRGLDLLRLALPGAARKKSRPTSDLAMVMTIGEVQPQEATIQVQEVANQVQAVTTQAHEATIQVPELPASSENNTSPSTIVAFEMSILVSGNNIPVFQVGDTTPLASSDTPPQLPLLLRCPRCQLLTTELVSPSK